MAVYNRYEKYQKYKDGLPLQEFKRGDLISSGEYDSLEDCELNVLYRWVNSGKTICDGYELHNVEVKEKSSDNGQSWVKTNETRTGSLIDKWSKECGVVTQYRWHPTGISKCEGINKADEFIYLKSEDMGNTWENVIPLQYKYELTDLGAEECVMALTPLTFTVDAGAEGTSFDYEYKSPSLFSLGFLDYSAIKEVYLGANYGLKFCYAIDWGDNTPIEKDFSIDVKHLDLSGSSYIYLASKVLKGKHTYRSGGLKTVKIWGPISDFTCNHIKEFISWGELFETSYVPSNEAIESYFANVVKQTIKVDEIRPYYGGEFITKSLQFNIFNINDGFFSEFLKDNGHFNYNKTFLCENNTNLIDASGITLSAQGINSLKEFKFNNCVNLKIGPKMWYSYRLHGRLPIAEEVFNGCVNVEELPFTGDFYLRSNILFMTKLRKITGILRGGTGYLCKGLTSLNDISLLELNACDTSVKFTLNFMNCPNISTIKSIKFVYGESIFENSGITTVDLTLLTSFEDSTGAKPRVPRMFFNCKNLTKVTGILSNTANLGDASSMFEDCSNLTSVSALFKNHTNTLPKIDRMFARCNISVLPEDFFAWDYSGKTLNIPKEMFAENKNLSNYPKHNEYPMWKYPQFFLGTITQALTFVGCDTLDGLIPAEWYGTTYDNVGISYKRTLDSVGSLYVYSGLEIECSYDGFKLIYTQQFEFPLNKVINIKAMGKWRVPDGRIEVYNFGSNAFYLNNNFIEYLGTNNGAMSYITELPDTEPYAEGEMWRNVKEIHPDFFKNATKITSLQNWLYQNHLVKKLPKMSYLTALTNVSGMLTSTRIENLDDAFANCPNLVNASRLTGVLYTSEDNLIVKSAKRAFANCPKLENVSYAFMDLENLIDVTGIFDGCTNLKTMLSCFRDCKGLKTLPNLNDCKNVTDFRFAFGNCKLLEGTTPVDENGYKLWERAGKPGYPASIDGSGCFSGCSKLTDYDQIPSSWK